MIKGAIDALRGRKGYAGMAAYHEGRLLFYDGLEPGLSDMLRCLFDDCGASFQATAVTAVMRGYTIAMFPCEGLLLICRFEGRFTPVPRPGAEETEYSTGELTAGLITREEARQEAIRILDSFELDPR